MKHSIDLVYFKNGQEVEKRQLLFHEDHPWVASTDIEAISRGIETAVRWSNGGVKPEDLQTTYDVINTITSDANYTCMQEAYATLTLSDDHDYAEITHYAWSEDPLVCPKCRVVYSSPEIPIILESNYVAGDETWYAARLGIDLNQVNIGDYVLVCGAQDEGTRINVAVVDTLRLSVRKGQISDSATQPLEADSTGNGGFGTVDSAGNFKTIKIWKPGSFASGWTHIVNTSHGIFFYNATNGGGGFGIVDSAGNFKTIKGLHDENWKPGSFASGWTHIVNTSHGIFFYC